MAILLNGKKLSTERRELLKTEVSLLPSAPTLVIIQIGEVAESTIYIQGKIRMAERLGIRAIHVKYEADIPETKLIDHIEEYNQDNAVHGILVQLPLPPHLNVNTVIETIDPKKDVDGLTSRNVKELCTSNDGIVPATTKGILTLLKEYRIDLNAKHVVIVGRSALVGKPTALACINENATVTVCHSKTVDLEAITKTADIIITATGKKNLITASHVVLHQVVIDVGIHATEVEGVRSICGDVDFEEVQKIVSAISPVPGGVGPMTIISLFENLVDLYKKHANV